jgi:hypothetical protein
MKNALSRRRAMSLAGGVLAAPMLAAVALGPVVAGQSAARPSQSFKHHGGNSHA